jgi:glycosyltransferase involved in cell wall biosynthesis
MTMSKDETKANAKTKNTFTRVLWVSPNINHYKKRLLDHLARDEAIELHVITGRMATELGHRHDSEKSHFRNIPAKATKKNFALHWQTYWLLSKEILSGSPDTVLFPLEKKLLPLLLWVKFLKIFTRFRLISYNHPVMPMRLWKKHGFDKWVTKTLFKLYNGVVFYTKTAKEWSVNNKMIAPAKAYYANNTLDTQTIRQHAVDTVNKTKPFHLLFIGRLIPSKRIDLAIQYFETLQRTQKGIKLTVIGDGPLAEKVEQAAAKNSDITWLGAITEESKIAPEMDKAHAVFIPGETGLSVIHAFAYGKPYFTLNLPSLTHGPELSYLESGVNGLLLSGEKEKDCDQILALMGDKMAYETMCKAAKEKADYLSIDNWREQMVGAIAP